MSSEDRRLNQSRSTVVIPGWARREERLSRSELYQLFRIGSDAVLHMNLIHWIKFGSFEVRRLNRALEKTRAEWTPGSRPLVINLSSCCQRTWLLQELFLYSDNCAVEQSLTRNYSIYLTMFIYAIPLKSCPFVTFMLLFCSILQSYY